VVFLGLAAVGMLEDDGEEPGSERFHELADPARTLHADDLRQPAREAAGVPRG
jgi:hypothetical protein